MPLTRIQTQVLKAIAANRSPESYLAGATVLHRDSDTPRFFQAIDLFHDLEESVALCAETDAATLRDAGYEFRWLIQTPSFYRAVLSEEGQQLQIEWAQDSAFRFFPVQEDDQCGYRLNHGDAALNKLLALAGRQEIRDFVDILHLHDTYLHLGAMAWAACGKDPGFSPRFLLEQAGRHVAYTQADVDRLSLRDPLDLKSMKKRWLQALEDARQLTETLPPDEVGCLYLDVAQTPVTPSPGSDDYTNLTRHYGSIRGAWPTVR
jgi:hypothetical protein